MSRNRYNNRYLCFQIRRRLFMDENTNQNIKKRKEDAQGTGSNDQKPYKQNPNSAYPRNRRRRSGTAAQSSGPRTQGKNPRQEPADNTVKKAVDINPGKNQKQNRQQPANQGEIERSPGRRRNTSRPRDNNTVTGNDKDRRPRNQRESGPREDFQKTNTQKDVRNQPRDNRRSSYSGKNDRSIENTRFSRNRVQVVETLDDIRRENERLEKEIWLEIADFHIMTLD